MFDHVFARGLRADFRIEIDNPPVRTDIERPAHRTLPLRVHYAISGRDFFFGIREDGVIGLNVLREFLVGVRIVDACREIRDVLERTQIGAALTERLAFGRSTSGECGREPGKHHGLAFVIRQAMNLAVGPLEREVWRAIANLQNGLRRRRGLRWRGALLDCSAERHNPAGDRPCRQ